MTAEIYPFPELKPNMPSLPAMVSVLRMNFTKLDETDQKWLQRAILVVHQGEEVDDKVVREFAKICHKMFELYGLKCDEFEVLPVA